MALNDLARTSPDKPAYINAVTGEAMTYAELNSASIRLGHALRSKLHVGDRVAILLENTPSYFIACWACRRSGLYFVPINWHLGTEEAAYIVENSDARALIASHNLSTLAQSIAESNASLEILISEDQAFGSFVSLEEAIAPFTDEPASFEPAGQPMTYSSGTTGQPKGILRELSGASFEHEPLASEAILRGPYEVDETTVYYHPAPMYHAAPLMWSLGVQAIGGTVIMSQRFDPEETLRVIDAFKVTHAQFVPTHFVRMLQLSDEIRGKYDHSSLRQVVHAAAPCPIEVKERMIDWWGPIIKEFYSGSEGAGITVVDSHEWLAHRGTVGRSITGPIHIVDDNDVELPQGETGHIAFENGVMFEYHKAEEKTADFFTRQGWAKPGDIGWLDADGYLYLADRSSHMIISGGVNIYPQEIENVLALHPALRDVAVIGVPDPIFGESVRAVVELADGVAPSEELASELIEYCRSRLAGFKCPKAVDFVDQLPRLPTGKLLKRELRKRYWGEASKIIAG